MYDCISTTQCHTNLLIIIMQHASHFLFLLIRKCTVKISSRGCRWWGNSKGVYHRGIGADNLPCRSAHNCTWLSVRLACQCGREEKRTRQDLYWTRSLSAFSTLSVRPFLQRGCWRIRYKMKDVVWTKILQIWQVSFAHFLKVSIQSLYIVSSDSMLHFT